MKKLRFGLIGCGRISSQHLDSVRLYRERAEIVAVCDILPSRARETADKYHISDWYQDYHQLLKREDIDVISICTPNGLHRVMATDTAKSGKHALVEKPLAISLKDAEQMLRTFQKEHKRLFAVLQVRHNPPVKYMQKFVTELRLGQVRYATLIIRWYRPPEYFKDTWRGTKKYDGGSLLNQGIHYLDALQWIVGGVDGVSFAKTLNLCHRIEIEDTAFALIKLKHGGWANIEFSLCGYPQNSECSLTLVGEKGTVKIGGQALDELVLWNVPGVKKPTLTKSIKPNRYSGGLYQGSCPYHFLIYREVLNALQKKYPNPIEGKEAIASIRIVEEIYRSALPNNR